MNNDLRNFFAFFVVSLSFHNKPQFHHEEHEGHEERLDAHLT